MATEKITTTVADGQSGNAEDMETSSVGKTSETSDSQTDNIGVNELREGVENDKTSPADKEEGIMEDKSSSEDALEEERLDFSDEEAQIAADAPEFQLGDDEEQEDHEAHEEAASEMDLAGMSKSQLLDLFAQLLAERPVQTLRKDVEAIKIAFYKIHPCRNGRCS